MESNFVYYAITELLYPLSEINTLTDNERAFLYAAIDVKIDRDREAYRKIQAKSNKGGRRKR